jgi:hypothetical protein
MQILDGSWSIVLVGNWNRFILSPEWAGNQLFGETELQLEYPENDPTKPLRYRFTDNILFIPANHRVTTIAQDPYSDQMLLKIVEANKRLVQTLSYTPISAMGMNFGFEERPENFELLPIFEFADAQHLNEINFDANAFEIKRRFPIENGNLNLTINYVDHVVFEFNFHYNVSNARNVDELLAPDLMLQNRDIALNILSNAYGLEIDEEEEE